MEKRYNSISLLGKTATYDEIMQFIGKRDGDSELPISNNLSLYYEEDDDTLTFEVVYDDIRDFKNSEEFVITAIPDKEVMEWLLLQMTQLDTAEKEMWEWVKDNSENGRVMLSDGKYYDIDEFEKYDA